MEFEWDADKNALNIRKHGFDFADARQCFDGPLLVREDRRRDYGETRWVALGQIQQVVVNVVFTMRGSRTRIISLRGANRLERQVYSRCLPPRQSD